VWNKSDESSFTWHRRSNANARNNVASSPQPAWATSSPQQQKTSSPDGVSAFASPQQARSLPEAIQASPSPQQTQVNASLRDILQQEVLQQQQVKSTNKPSDRPASGAKQPKQAGLVSSPGPKTPIAAYTSPSASLSTSLPAMSLSASSTSPLTTSSLWGAASQATASPVGAGGRGVASLSDFCITTSTRKGKKGKGGAKDAEQEQPLGEGLGSCSPGSAAASWRGPALNMQPISLANIQVSVYAMMYDSSLCFRMECMSFIVFSPKRTGIVICMPFVQTQTHTYITHQTHT
jgi:hypothetical protein